MKRYSKVINVVLCLGIALGYIGLLRLLGAAWGLVVSGDDSSYFSEAVIGGMISTVLVLILFCVKKTEILRDRGIGFFNGLKVAAFLIVVSFLVLVSNLADNIGSYSLEMLMPSLFFIIAMFFTGFCEEVVFRGMILQILWNRFGKDSRSGIYLSVVLSGLIFGSLHIFNVFAGVQLSGAIMQAIGAAGLGMYFGAVYIRTQNLWLLILLHGFNNFAGLAGNGIFGINSIVDVVSAYDTAKLAGVVLYIFLAFFLLRDSKITTVIKERKESDGC